MRQQAEPKGMGQSLQAEAAPGHRGSSWALTGGPGHTCLGPDPGSSSPWGPRVGECCALMKDFMLPWGSRLVSEHLSLHGV